MQPKQLSQLQDAMNRCDVKAISDVLGLESMVERAEKRALAQPIEIMCAIFADVDPAELPKCESCETAFALIPCKSCKAFYCQSCKPDHPCCQPDGPNLYDVTRG